MSGISVKQWDGQRINLASKGNRRLGGKRHSRVSSGRALGLETMLSWRGSGWRQRVEKEETRLSGLS